MLGLYRVARVYNLSDSGLPVYMSLGTREPLRDVLRPVTGDYSQVKHHTQMIKTMIKFPWTHEDQLCRACMENCDRN